jgi:hypothetical protein
MAQTTGKGPTKGSGPDGWNPPDVDDVIDPTFDDGDLENLGLEGEQEEFVEDPAGWEPTTDPQEIGGRKMHRMSPQDLYELHRAHAGDAPMMTDPYAHLEKGHVPADEDEIEESLKEQKRRRQNDGPSPDELLKNYKKKEEESKSTTPTETSSIDDDTDEPIQIDPGQAGEAVRLVESLVNKATQLRNEGDLRQASELTAIATRIVNAAKVKRKQPEQPRHPALAKLLNNFGLERIEPVKISWMGSVWVFAPRPEQIDFWIGREVQDDASLLNICLIAGSLVGLGVDEPGADPPAPLWEVFNINLKASYEMEVPAGEGLPSDTEMFEVQVYHKVCESCSNETPVQSTKCEICGAMQDVFDVPLNLRLRYAQTTKHYLQEKMGLGAMEWGVLVDEMREKLPDRQLDREEVYPLAQPLFRARKTPGSAPGEE